MKILTTESSSDAVFYVAPEVKRQFLKAKDKVIEGEQDRVYLITGREGLGKSTLAQQFAYLCDTSFCIEDICFSADEFEKRIRQVPKHKAIVFDEAFNGLSSKGALSKENKRLVRLLMECRARSLFIFIVLPTIFLLEKYVAVFRSTALFNVLASKKDYKRRFYKVYNYQQKQTLYQLGRNLMDYSRPYIPIAYRFYGKIPPTINEKEYKDKKQRAFVADKKDSDEPDSYMNQRNVLLYYLNKKLNIPQETISNVLREHGIELEQNSISVAVGNVP